jgi:flagellar protein FliS
MTHSNPYAAYQQQAITTMTPGEMLVALYDGALKDISFAQEAFRQKNNSAVNENLQKVQRILLYLQSTLDEKYEISGSLNTLYTYFIEQIMQANIRKDASPLDEVAKDLAILRDAFAKADKAAAG